MSRDSHSRPQLTVALVVQDAAEAVAETLASVADLADEMLVVDAGSSDESREVAAQFAARLVDYEWSDDISAARNAARAQSSGDWILWLEPGERVSATAADELRDLLAHDADRNEAYVLFIKTPRRADHISAEQIAQVRLVPNRPEIKFEGRVRETVLPALADNGLVVEGLSITIDRGEREHDPDERAQRARRQLRLADIEIAERGPLAHLLNAQAEAQHLLKNEQRATQLYRAALGAAVRGSPDMLEAYYGLLATLDVDPRQRESQLSICLEALEVFPLDAQLLCLMGGYLQARGRLDLAARSYETAYKFGQVTPEVAHLDEIREIVAVGYSTALELQGRREKSLAIVEEACEMNTHSPRLRRRLTELVAPLRQAVC